MINLEKKALKVLKIVKKYKNYLIKPENLPQLAKIMKSWDKLYYSIRVTYGMKYNMPDRDKWLIEDKGWCENNPKDYLLEDEDLRNDLIYDAWCVNISEKHKNIPYYWEFQEPSLKDTFFSKPNKTIDDWQEFFDKCYPSLCTFRKSFLSRILCCIGTGCDWTKDGYIDHEGPSGVYENVYALWKMAKVDYKIVKELDKIFKIPEMEIVYKTMAEYFNEPDPAEEVMEMMTAFDKDWQEKIAKSRAEEQERQIENFKYYPIRKSSPIMNIPENAHISYVKAAEEICNDIISSSRESESNKKCVTEVLKKLKLAIN